MASYRTAMRWVKALRPAAGVLWLALAGPLLAEPESETIGTAPEVREFADWSVACDNAKRCEAVGVSAERARHAETEWGEAGLLVLRVTRDAGPAAQPRIVLGEGLWGGKPAVRPNVPTLHVLYPGEPERTGRAYRLHPLADGRHEVAPGDVAAFLAESAKTETAALRLGAIAGLGSTRGMVAALRFMDEAQGRRGTVTALYAKGPVPAGQVPAPRRLPPIRVTRGVAGSPGTAVQDDGLRREGLLICGVMAAPHTGMRYRLTTGDTLWRVDCGEEHSADSALNPRSVWFFSRPGAERIFPTFPRPEQGRAALPAYLPNSGFDPATGLLTATLYYGPGRDCGWQRHWAWSGREWQLVAGRELHACMGIMPEGWLPTWRSRPR